MWKYLSDRERVLKDWNALEPQPNDARVTKAAIKQLYTSTCNAPSMLAGWASSMVG